MSPGDVLADTYLLEARLGEGGMGEVWRAKRGDDERRVAVKVLRRDLAADEGAKRRFLREARAAMAVTHPNVVAVLDVHDDADMPFLVMELLAGETLGKRLRRKGSLDVAETAAVLLPVFDAVEAAHAAGIVHRDLKPENIFLANDHGTVRVCVLDFGIAKRVEKLATPMAGDAGTTTATATTGSMMGTPYYMAPEQALGERDIDGRADLWSIGIILYECLSGRRPTEAATLGGVLKILVTGAIAPLAEVRPDLDPELADEVMDLLRADREMRATSLGALRTSLEAHREPAKQLEVPIDAPPSTRVAPATPATSRRRPRLVAGTIASVALVSAVGVAYLRAARDATPATPVHLASTTQPAVTASATFVPSVRNDEPPPPAPSAAAPRPSSAARLATPPREKPVASSSVAPGAPSRGPSGLVTDNPFHP